MSRETKRTYLRLCPEKRQKKKNLVHKGLTRNKPTKTQKFPAVHYLTEK